MKVNAMAIRIRKFRMNVGFMALLVVIAINANPVFFSLARAAESQKDDSLVLHYKFDKDPGAVTKDLSGHGNDGKIFHAQWLKEVDGRRGVLRLDGKSSYIDCGDSDSLRMEGDTTIEMWVRQNGPIKSGGWACLFGEEPETNFDIVVVNWDSLVLWYRNSDNIGENVAIPVDRHILGDKWSYFAVVVEYPRCRFYRNGKLISDAYMPVPGISKFINRAKHIGGGGKEGDGRFAPIDLTEIRVYRRALSARELAADASDRVIVPPLTKELVAEPNWYGNFLTLRLTCKGVNYSGRKVEMTLFREDGAQVAASKKAPLEDVSKNGSRRYAAAVTFPLEQLKGQSLKAVAHIEGTGTQVTREITLKKPDWIYTQDGRHDKVLPPWTPLTASTKEDAVEVGIWGRRYDFSSTSLIQRIQTRGADILASPITLSGQAGGKDLIWKNGRVELKKSSETAATIEQSGQGKGVNFKINSTTEYDGYTIFDCEVKAAHDVDINTLKLYIPIKTQYATLCYGDQVFPDDAKIPMKVFYSGTVKGDLSFKFAPTVWLGNEELGLTWQADSDQDWHNADPQKAIEVLPKGKTTLLRLNLVDKPVKLSAEKSLHYKFALLATPVKPLVRDAWDLRIARSEPFGADLNLPDRKTNGEPTLQYYAKIGIRHLFTEVNDIWPWPMPIHEQFSKALHRLNDTAHGYGLKLYPYLIYESVPVNVPEFDIYGLCMSKRPLQQYIMSGSPAGDPRPGPLAAAYGANSQATVLFCAKSQALQDAYIHSLNEYLTKYGDDGVYLDGTCQMTACNNQLHGCGYRAADGSIHPTYATFETREFMKRIYTVVKEHKPDGVVDVHCSYGWNPAGLAYADVLWTGEQWWHLGSTGAPGGYIAGVLPLDMFRTEFTGYQLGVAAEMLTYRLGPPIKCAAISLLHDISPRLSTGNFDTSNTSNDPYFLMVPKLWKMRDQFGAEQAKKLFYWNNQQYVQVSPEKCYATLLQNPKTGVLALISNLSRDKQTVTVRFNLNKLGLTGQKLHVYDPLTDKAMTMDSDGRLSVSLGSEQWIYIWLRPENQ
jgi:hypothetical protein